MTIEEYRKRIIVLERALLNLALHEDIAEYAIQVLNDNSHKEESNDNTKV
jgi:hypothetical protein